nr:hypothetical protein [uncultured Dongia sp.]
MMQDKEFDAAMQDVSKAYGSPAALLADDDLSRKQKLKLLQQWDYDLGLLLVAAEENMAGPGSGATSERLRSVRDAIKRLGVEMHPEDTASSPNKMGTANIPESETGSDTGEPKRKVAH